MSEPWSLEQAARDVIGHGWRSRHIGIEELTTFSREVERQTEARVRGELQKYNSQRDVILADMQDASRAVDATYGTSEYQTALVTLALIARHYLREVVNGA